MWDSSLKINGCLYYNILLYWSECNLPAAAGTTSRAIAPPIPSAPVESSLYYVEPHYGWHTQTLHRLGVKYRHSHRPHGLMKIVLYLYVVHHNLHQSWGPSHPSPSSKLVILWGWGLREASTAPPISADGCARPIATAPRHHGVAWIFLNNGDVAHVVCVVKGCSES